VGFLPFLPEGKPAGPRKEFFSFFPIACSIMIEHGEEA
jgi:hypothetical protein